MPKLLLKAIKYNFVFWQGIDVDHLETKDRFHTFFIDLSQVESESSTYQTDNLLSWVNACIAKNDTTNSVFFIDDVDALELISQSTSVTRDIISRMIGFVGSNEVKFIYIYQITYPYFIIILSLLAFFFGYVWSRYWTKRYFWPWVWAVTQSVL